MSLKRSLTALLLVAVVCACLLPLAHAQDAPPDKGVPPGPSLPVEAAVLPLGAFPARPEVEPNNSLVQANGIDHAYWFASQVSGVINPRYDGDLFWFYGLRGDLIVISVAASRYGSNLDPVVHVIDSAGTVLAENDDPDEWDLDSYLSYTLPAEGDYFVRISDYDNQHGGTDHWYNLFFWAQQRSDEWNTTPYAPGDEEPNNTRAKAYPVGYGDTLPFARLDYDGDVDFYKFDGLKGDVARVSLETTGLHGTLESQLALYNSAGTLLASCGPANWGPNDTNCALEKLLPKDGTYYLKVSDAHNKGGTAKTYWLQVGFGELWEPNNSIAQAANLSRTGAIHALISQGDNVDVFSFYGRPGEYLTLRIDNLDLELLDIDGRTVLADTYFCGYGLSLRVPREGYYYVRVKNRAYTMADGDSYGDYMLEVDELLLLGTTTNGVASGAAYTKSDILSEHSAVVYSRLFFDGSDVGVKANLRDFHVFQDNSCLAYPNVEQPSRILMSLAASNVLPDYPAAFTALPQDIVALRGPELGPRTYGDWDMYMDGSEIGLTTAAEAVDAVGWAFGYGWEGLVFSTVGTATINSQNGPLTAPDEDLIGCEVNQTGWNTQLWCYRYLDGSAAGIPATADIASVWIDPWNGATGDGDIYMTFAAATVINGVTYRPNDVAVCRPQTSPQVSACTWLPKYWQGNFEGFSGKLIDGLDLLGQAP